jgi:hypothetical protein
LIAYHLGDVLRCFVLFGFGSGIGTGHRIGLERSDPRRRCGINDRRNVSDRRCFG